MFLKAYGTGWFRVVKGKRNFITRTFILNVIISLNKFGTKVSRGFLKKKFSHLTSFHHFRFEALKINFNNEIFLICFKMLMFLNFTLKNVHETENRYAMYFYFHDLGNILQFNYLINFLMKNLHKFQICQMYYIE